MQKKLLALVLRGSSMGAKFLLVIGLSKTLSTSDYGVFSLILTSLTFLIFFLGLDFYNFSHREIIDNDSAKIQIVINQFWLHVLCYVIYLPLIYIIFASNTIPIMYFLPFYILLILEHIGQELFRFLNLFNKPNQANITLFVRTALWILLMVLIEIIWRGEDLSISSILNFWIVGSLSAIIYGVGFFIFKSPVKLKNINFFILDFKWVKKGVKISIPFFLGTIAYKAIEYSDRYMIDWFMSKEDVGVYSFYTNFANIINIIVNTITVTLLVPNLLRSVSAGVVEDIKIKIENFTRELYLTTIGVSLIIVFLIFPILTWLNKEEFSNQISIYFIVLMANIIFNISLFYHFMLYAYKKDKLIFKPTFYACIINIMLNIVFIPMFGIIAAAISTLVSFSIILVLKRKYWLKIRPI